MFVLGVLIRHFQILFPIFEPRILISIASFAASIKVRTFIKLNEMMMTREEYIKICNTCANRGFDPSQGVVCGLNGELPAFEDNCADYQMSEEEKIRLEGGPELSVHEEGKQEGARNDVLWGAVWCMGGIVATASDLGFVFWGAIVYGAIQFFRGLSNGGASGFGSS